MNILETKPANEAENEAANETGEAANGTGDYPPAQSLRTPDGLIEKSVSPDGRILSTHLYPSDGGPDMNVVVMVDGKAVFAGRAVDGMHHRTHARKIADKIHEAMVYNLNRTRRKRALRKARRAEGGAK